MVNPYYGAPPQAVPPQPQGNGMAVAAMVLGILALVLFWAPVVNWLLALLAIVFGIVGLMGANKRGGAGKGMAIAGLACGIVSAVIGVLIVLLFVRTMHEVKRAVDDISKLDDAKMTVDKYAFEAYPEWSQSHPDAACPKTIADLADYVGANDRTDPWGHDYQMFCGDTLPAGAKGIGIMSSGPDGIPNTEDDIKSW